MIKKQAAFLAAAMLLAAPAMADEMTNPMVGKLIDLTAFAAVQSGESMLPQNGERLSPAFCQAVFQRGAGTLGLTEQNAADWFESAYGVLPADGWQTWQIDDQEDAYIGVLILSVGPADSEASGAIVSGSIYRAPESIHEMNDEELLRLEWLGESFTAWLRPCDLMAGEWQLTGYQLGHEVQNVASAGFMVDYASASLGVYGAYPAAFSQAVLVEASEGISGVLPDGSAEFAMISVARDGLEAEELISEMKAYGSEVEIDPATGAIRGRALLDNNMYKVEAWLIGKERLYHMELCYNAEQAAMYEKTAEYMLNAFGAYELGVS